jgi:hypothetical protein
MSPYHRDVAGGVDARSSTRLVLEQERPRWGRGALAIALVAGVIAFGIVQREPDTTVARPGPIAPILVPAPGTTGSASATVPAEDPSIEALEKMLPSTTTTLPQWVLDDFDPTKPRLPVAPPTTIDYELAAAKRDLTINIVPDEPTALVGSVIHLTVSITNRGGSAYDIDAGPSHGIWAAMRYTPAYRGTPSPSDAYGFRTDGPPLRWYLEATRYDAKVYESGSSLSQSDGPNPPTRLVLPGGGVVSARFAIVASVSGAMPTEQVHLAAGVAVAGVGSSQYRVIDKEVGFDLVDEPERSTSWVAAMTNVGADPLVTQWLLGHQGRIDDPYHGVFTRVRYLDSAWEVRFVNPRIRASGGSNSPRSFQDLIVRADAHDAGRVIDVHEVESMPVMVD